MTRTRTILVCALAALPLSLAACGDDEGGGESTTDGTVTLTSPDDGARLAGGVAVAMRASGVTIEEAGEVHDGAGHFHVIADDGCAEPGTAVPRDVDHVHLGDGSAEAVMYLAPGRHELCVQVADGEHFALAASSTVSVDVGVTSQEEWCDVVAEVDDLLAGVEVETDGFETVQGMAAQAQRLIEQLDDGVVQVDEEVRTDVGEQLEFVASFLAAWVDAASEDEADAALEELFAGDLPEQGGPAAQWILDTCGVDIED